MNDLLDHARAGEPPITSAEASERIAALKNPRVTREGIEAKIDKTAYFTYGVLTLCVLTMRSGFTFTGQAACAHEANFDPGVGKRLAYEDAVRQIWSHEGYLLKEGLWSVSGRPA